MGKKERKGGKEGENSGVFLFFWKWKGHHHHQQQMHIAYKTSNRSLFFLCITLLTSHHLGTAILREDDTFRSHPGWVSWEKFFISYYTTLLKLTTLPTDHSLTGPFAILYIFESTSVDRCL